ncbi:MAG: amidohydrolase family protein [SAR86 cluster bacterium]|uniref:Amidohydrolase family protein n=1 Tax=SAR86 cluster bacterium TaxID=2030880 RepID=A0A973A995_9GAMM|nr:amidohydrolase family protein [SAR86 cluster bacterium]
MAMPENIGIIDLMLAVPNQETSNYYDFIKPLLMDEQSREMFKMPAQYMFKDIPNTGKQDDYLAYTIDKMDEFGIEKAMVGVDESQYESQNEAVLKYPDRFFGSYDCNPNNGMEEVRKIRRLKEKYNLKAVTAFPSGLCPQVSLDDKRWYPIFVACVDLDLPFCPCVGVPGPRIPMAPQKVEHLDEICWFFPELKVVMRHGAEPWTELAWKLMLKYPNLYYMTSAFAPKHYPPDIINFANTRGSDKIMYAGYFPMGLSLERIFGDMPHVPFRDEVWPKFLRENAQRVFNV